MNRKIFCKLGVDGVNAQVTPVRRRESLGRE